MIPTIGINTYQKTNGFSLIEFCVVIAIMGIVIPWGYSRILRLSQINALEIQATQLSHIIETARNLSAMHRDTHIICGTRDGKNCASWDSPYWMIAPQHLSALWASDPSIEISYRGFPTAKKITFSPEGLSTSNGHFYLKKGNSNGCLYLSTGGTTRWSAKCDG